MSSTSAIAYTPSNYPNIT